MKRLFTLDLHDYDENWRHDLRPTVRGIIKRDGKLALVHSEGDYYGFPGGGIEDGETYEEALIREVKEETGLVVIPESIKEYGGALRLNKSTRFPETVFEQENFYYKCEVLAELGEQDDYDKAVMAVYRCLEPDGYLYAIESEWMDIPAILQVFEKMGQEPWNCFTEAQMSWHDRFLQAGFEIVSEELVEHHYFTAEDNDLGEASVKFGIPVGTKETAFVLRKK